MTRLVGGTVAAGFVTVLLVAALTGLARPAAAAPTVCPQVAAGAGCPDPSSPVTTSPPAATPPVTLPPSAPPGGGDDDNVVAPPAGMDNLLGEEEYGPYPISHYDIGCDEGGALSFGRKGMCWLTSIPFELDKTVVGVGNTIITWAMSFELADAFKQLSLGLTTTYNTRIVGGLRLQHLAWFAAVVWAGWLALRARLAQGLGELATSAVVAAVGAILLANPAGYFDGALTLVRNSSGAIVEAVSADHSQDTNSVSSAVATQIQAAFVDQAYDLINWGAPLGSAQYSGTACQGFRNEALASGPHGNDDEPRNRMDDDETCQSYRDFNHRPNGERARAAWTVLVGAFIVLVLLVIMAGTLIGAQLILVIGWAVSPVVWAVGIAPGGARRLLWRWLGAFAQMLLVVLACTFLLSFLALSVAWALSSTQDLSITKRAMFVDVLVVMAFWLRKRFVAGAQAIGARLGDSLGTVVPGRNGAAWVAPLATGGITGWAIRSHVDQVAAELPGGRRLARRLDHRRLAHTLGRSGRSGRSGLRGPSGQPRGDRREIINWGPSRLRAGTRLP